MFGKLYIFLWRDFAEQRSYRLPFVIRNFALFMPIPMLLFMRRMFEEVNVPSIERYGGDYVTFLFVGVIVAAYSDTALRSFSTGLRRAQRAGTLEILFSTRANLFTIVFGWSLFPMIRTSLGMAIYLVAGFAILGLNIRETNFIGVILTSVLSLAAMTSIGIVVLSFTLVFKQGDLFTRIVVSASTLLSGAFYPLDVLPGFMRALANIPSSSKSHS